MKIKQLSKNSFFLFKTSTNYLALFKMATNNLVSNTGVLVFFITTITRTKVHYKVLQSILYSSLNFN